MGHQNSSDPAMKTLPVTDISLLADVEGAIAQEHDLTFFQSLKLYPKAAFWSIVLSTTVIMEGYDTKLLTTLFAQPEFVRAYGKHIKGKTYQISAPWQLGLANGGSVGALAGLMTAGYMAERIGFRKTLIAGLILTIGLIFIQFFAPNLTVLLVGQILFGRCFRPFLTSTLVTNTGYRVSDGHVPSHHCRVCSRNIALEPSRLSDQLCPILLGMGPTCILRRTVTFKANILKAFGQIIATGILRGVLYRSDSWAYRIPFAVQ